MKVLVLGGGVIGVTTAYYLARAGHEVTVVDRQPGPALETSFANAGEVSPGYASPWAGPGVPVKAIKWLLMKHGPLVIRPKLDPADERSRGTLQLFRAQAQLDGTAGDIAVLKQYGVPYEVLDRAGCVGAEPALAAVKHKFAGGLRLPQDETGDCHMFTQALADHAAKRGVEFRLGTTVEHLIAGTPGIIGVATSAGVLQADAYVVALGSWSPRLLGPLGISIPVYPVKGYSITVPIVDSDAAPVSTVMDESYKVAITRLGDRIRVGGTAEVSGYSDKLYSARRATLDHSLTDLFPNGGNPADATFWSGLRPMTPDGPPVIGATRYSNLYLNTGHGTLGWTMACGSGCVLADLLSGRKPEIDTAELALARYEDRFG